MRLKIPRQVINTLMFLVKSLLQRSGHSFVNVFVPDRRDFFQTTSQICGIVSLKLKSISKVFLANIRLRVHSHRAIHNKHKLCQGDAGHSDWFTKQWDL